MNDSALMQTYGRLPVAFEQGEGAWLVDSDGRRYLDALCGIAVCGLGHAHPGVAEALSRQARTLVHTSNLYRIPLQEALATRLCSAAGMERAFFGNSGAEANEAAIKLARLHGHRQGIKQPTIVVMDGAFHGRTMATLTATGNRKAQAGFEPLLKGFVRAPFGDVEAVRKIAANQPEVVAVLVEPIQGEGGIRMPEPGYLEALRALCDEQDWLLMLDEVQTGSGRTGKLFAYQHTNILPDVVTVAKGIANGVPIGVCMARGQAAEVLGPGTHGSTFGGNPLAAAAAMATLDALEDGLYDRASSLGERIRQGLATALEGCNQVVEIRGRGLMIGIELSQPAPELVKAGLAAGILINVTQERVLRLLPPLILTDAEADDLVGRVAGLIRDLS